MLVRIELFFYSLVAHHSYSCITFILAIFLELVVIVFFLFSFFFWRKKYKTPNKTLDGMESHDWRKNWKNRRKHTRNRMCIYENRKRVPMKSDIQYLSVASTANDINTCSGERELWRLKSCQKVEIEIRGKQRILSWANPYWLECIY